MSARAHVLHTNMCNANGMEKGMIFVNRRVIVIISSLSSFFACEHGSDRSQVCSSSKLGTI